MQGCLKRNRKKLHVENMQSQLTGITMHINTTSTKYIHAAFKIIRFQKAPTKLIGCMECYKKTTNFSEAYVADLCMSIVCKVLLGTSSYVNLHCVLTNSKKSVFTTPAPSGPAS